MTSRELAYASKIEDLNYLQRIYAIPTLDVAVLLEQTLVSSNTQKSSHIRLIRGFMGVWGSKKC